MLVCFECVLSAAVESSVPQAGDSNRIVKSVVRADASGRLVRARVLAPVAVRETLVAARPVINAVPAAEPPAASHAASTFREAVDQIAAKNNLAPQLVHSVIAVESNYNPNAISPKGAQGLLQLIPAT